MRPCMLSLNLSLLGLFHAVECGQCRFVAGILWLLQSIRKLPGTVVLLREISLVATHHRE